MQFRHRIATATTSVTCIPTSHDYLHNRATPSQARHYSPRESVTISGAPPHQNGKRNDFSSRYFCRPLNPIKSSRIVGKNFPFHLWTEAVHRFEPCDGIEIARLTVSGFYYLLLIESAEQERNIEIPKPDTEHRNMTQHDTQHAAMFF